MTGDRERTPTALVTGAGRGIGRRLASALAENGLRVAVNDINPDRAAATARLVEAAGGAALVHIADISKKFPVQAMFNAVEDAWGRPDVVVNCARVLPRMGALEMDEWDWRRTLDVNLTGAFLLTQVAGRVMRPSGTGLIIHVVGTSADPGDAAAGIESTAVRPASGGNTDGNEDRSADGEDAGQRDTDGNASGGADRVGAGNGGAAVHAARGGLLAFARAAEAELRGAGIRLAVFEPQPGLEQEVVAQVIEMVLNTVSTR